jgi:hypothetical protein
MPTAVDYTAHPSFWFVAQGVRQTPIFWIAKDGLFLTYWYATMPDQQAEGLPPECDPAVQFDVRMLPGWVEPVYPPPHLNGQMRRPGDEAVQAYWRTFTGRVAYTINRAAAAGLLP